MSQEDTKRDHRRLIIKIVFDVMGIISGVGIFSSFLSIYHNYNAAIWGLIYAILAVVLLHLHTSYRRNCLQRAYSATSLNFMKNAAIIGTITVIIACCAYIIIAVIEKQGYQVYDYGYAPAAVFSLMNIKWTILLYFESKKYLKKLENDDAMKNIVTDSNSAPESLNLA